MRKKALLILAGLMLVTGCAAPEKKAEYKKITAQEAYGMLEKQENIVLLDVRTKEEFDAGHIPGALLLPNTEIGAKAAQALPDKSAVILVYCRSGNRSKTASNELLAMGYENVYDFGGIIDWPYEVVTE